MTDFLLIILIVVSLANLFEIRRWRRFVVLLMLHEGVVIAQPPAYGPVAGADQRTSAGPASEVAAALADARRLSPDQAKYTRYLSCYNIPVAKRAEFLKVLTFHVNNLSREADFAVPRQVSPTLVAVEIDAYGWEGTTYGKLFEVDPWFHTQAVVEGKKMVVHAPWLVGHEIAELVKITGSVVPLLRADWFIFQTGEALNRKASYYDFLGLKKQVDAEKLAGLDRATAIRIRRELGAIVAESTVALNNRQIFRFSTVGGSWWETRDVDTSVDRKNAIRNLNGDFGPPDALEVYFTIPNGLWGFVLANGAGELQATAPDRIASDSFSTNTDRRVRINLSCIRCHSAGGLQQIDDYARKVFRLENQLGIGSPDRDKARRLKSVYLGPLQENLTSDIAQYSKRLKELTGWTPLEASKAYSSAWSVYESGAILPADAAREIGVEEQALIAALRINLKGSGVIDLGLSGFLATPPIPIRREQWEEQVSSVFTLMIGGNVKSKRP